MRFYPFGSGSLDTSNIPTASVSSYALEAQSTLRVVSASRGVNGVNGLQGLPGSCSYSQGLTGPTGEGGTPGLTGTISYAS
jgi:hypothetical protein